MTLDKFASEWTPDSLRDCFCTHGCAVVREVVPTELLGRINTAVEGAYRVRTDAVHIDGSDIQAADGELTGFEVADTPLLRGFLDRVYIGQKYRPYNVVARRIQGVQNNKEYQQPLDLHVDAQFHSPCFTINFWVPFVRAGLDRPGLCLVPVNYKRTRRYVGYTGQLLREDEFNCGYFDRGRLTVEAITREFGADCFLKPVVNAGDLVVSSNWIIHGSHQTPDMPYGRTSMEVRFIGNTRDIVGVRPIVVGRSQSTMRVTREQSSR